MFPYPEIGNEELEEMNMFVAPVEKFFNEQGKRKVKMSSSQIYVSHVVNIRS